MSCRIIKCGCKSEFQDKLYGSGKRAMNKTTKGFRCTICTKEQSGAGK
jgi:hypothetical protein